jgi:phosphoglycolate phosphatase-like HAD superfamily hydrolase
MIGDTKHDIEAAKAAGVVSVLVGWSEALPEEKRAREAKPDYVIGSWQEVPALLGANLR